MTMLNNIQFKVLHIDGFQNRVADSLSRFQMARFRSLVPTADRSPAVIPESLNDLSDCRTNRRAVRASDYRADPKKAVYHISLIERTNVILMFMSHLKKKKI